MTDCPRRRWYNMLRCRFEPRYDFGGLSGKIETVWGFDPFTVNTLNAMRPKTYVLDICVRCGRTIERNKAASP